jgi:hypothetical protein
LRGINLILGLYLRPSSTFSRILDEGRLKFAFAAAIAVVLALQAPRAMEQARVRQAEMTRLVNAHIAEAAAKGPLTKDEEAEIREETEDEFADGAPVSRLPTIQNTVGRFTAVSPTQIFSPVVALAVCFVPMAILVLASMESLGSFSMVLQRDYSSLLVCSLLAWTAAHLPLAAVNGALGVLHSPAYNHPALWWAAHAYFLVLTAVAMRTLFGARLPSAAGAIGGAWAGAIGGIWVFSTIGGGFAYIASPCLMFYLYRRFAPGISSLGGGLNARQRLKQGLENATLNPADADAHYQLGLIYAQRRQRGPAVECFRKSIEVGPNEPDAYYQLGRIAREQGRYQEALECCRTAARLDDKHSSSEVWREIGIASLLDGDTGTALQALEKYLDRRPYDPEGLCWYGRTLAKLDQPDAARAAFEQAIDAVRTMPQGRRRQLRSWESESARELKKLA